MRIPTIGLALALSVTAAPAAALVNGGFEASPPLSGWTVFPTTGVNPIRATVEAAGFGVVPTEGRLQGVDFTIDGREVGLYFVEPGDFCGELGLFDDGPQPEYVIALTASVVVYVPAAELREIMLKTPDVMNVLGGKLAARVRQMTYQRSLLVEFSPQTFLRSQKTMSLGQANRTPDPSRTRLLVSLP